MTVLRLRARPLAACLAAALAGSPVEAAPIDAGATDAIHRSIAALERTTGRRLAIVSLAPAGTPNALHVANCNDAGAGSLRDAIAVAGDLDVIDLTHLACSRITLTSGELVATQSRLSLLGPGANGLAIDAVGASRVISHTGNLGLRITGVTITGGAADGAGGCIETAAAIGLYDTVVSACTARGNGGAVYAATQFFMDRTTITGSTTTLGNGGGAFLLGGFAGLVESTLSGNTAPAGGGGGLAGYDTIYVSRSTLSANSAQHGGGLYSLQNGGSATVNIAGSTISGNVAASRGGGVELLGGLRVIDSTIAFNTAGTRGGGVYTTGGIALGSAILANNTAGAAESDLDGPFGVVSNGNNSLVMVSTMPLPGDTLHDDPMLAPLADNGGYTLTHALVSGSVAVDHGDDSFMRYDQRYRGSSRIVGASADIGAYELQTIGSSHVVTNCEDTGDGSLRDAIDHAKSGDTIDLSALACGRIVLSQVLGIGVGTLTLTGPGANALVLDGGVVDRVIEHTGYGTLTLSGLTIGYGASSDYNGGGCIRAISTLDIEDSTVKSCGSYGTTNGIGGGIYAGRLTLERSTVSGNFTMGQLNASGGGIAVAGDFTMRDSYVTGNRAVTTYDHIEPKAESRAGGILASRGGHVTISGSTIAGNEAGNASLELPGYFGGIAMYGAYSVPSLIENTTISGNTAASANAGLYASSIVTIRNSTIAFNVGIAGAQYLGPFSAGLHVAAPWFDLSSTIVANNATAGSFDDLSGTAEVIGANNLVRVATIPVPPDTLTDDPLLAGLGFNGGPTPTHALLPGSPAIDRGNNDANLATDQRGAGFARVAGAGADIGAFEVQSGPPDAIFADGFDG